MSKRIRHSWGDFVPPMRRCVWCGLLQDKGAINPQWARNPKAPKYFIQYRTMKDDKLLESAYASDFQCNRKEQS